MGVCARFGSEDCAASAMPAQRGNSSQQCSICDGDQCIHLPVVGIAGHGVNLQVKPFGCLASRLVERPCHLTVFKQPCLLEFQRATLFAEFSSR
jgi:hypothetical protein